jgi:hypothetical protein
MRQNSPELNHLLIIKLYGGGMAEKATKQHSTPNDTKIAPSLKAFMNKALPGKEGGHVLAVGEDHDQETHLKWMESHLDELKEDHNLGGIGFEFAPFMEVLLSAYKDGELPVGDDPEEAKPYVERMYTIMTEDPKSAKVETSLMFSALDKDVPVTFFDSRESLQEKEEKVSPHIKTLSERMGANKGLREDLRQNKDGAFDRLYTDERRAFLILEAQQLLKDNPKYQAQLDNTEAVMTARQTWQKDGKQEEGYPGDPGYLGYDVISAAIMQARIPEGKNVITVSGFQHILGLEDRPDGVEGTFAQHLDALGLKTSTALMGDSAELRDSFLEGGGPLSFGSQFSRQDHPYHLPTLLAIDTGEVVPPAQEITQQPDAKTAPLAARVYENKQEYNEKNPHLADAAFPSPENKEEVATSQKALMGKEIQAAIAGLKENLPWADMGDSAAIAPKKPEAVPNLKQAQSQEHSH